MTAKKKQPLTPLRQRAFDAVKVFQAIVTREGWTQEQVNEKTKFGLSTIGRWLRGAHAPNSRVMIEALEKFNAKYPIPQE